MTAYWKPSRDQVRGSHDKTVADPIVPGLKILFSGINPSLYSAAVGHHFARPGNRYWPTLHNAGFTPRLFSPFEDRSLLDLGYGITNVVDRATASAVDLSVEELIEGRRRLEEKVDRNRPKIVAFLGITAYRSAFGLPDAKLGLQTRTISRSKVWVLPNPSGLNAHYQLSELVRLYGELREGGEFIATQPPA